MSTNQEQEIEEATVVRKLLALADDLKRKEEQIVQLQEDLYAQHPALARKLFPTFRTRLLSFERPAFDDISSYTATGYHCVVIEDTDTKQFLVSGLKPPCSPLEEYMYPYVFERTKGMFPFVYEYPFPDDEFMRLVLVSQNDTTNQLFPNAFPWCVYFSVFIDSRMRLPCWNVSKKGKL